MKEKIKTQRGFIKIPLLISSEARKKYWTEKIKRNKQRDKEVNRYYEKIGWKIVRIWEHKIIKNLDNAINKKIICLLSKRHE